MPEPFSATAPLKSVKGTENKPGVTFTGDEDTGLYNPGPNELSVSVGGSEKAKFTDTGVSLDGDINLDDGGTFTTTVQTVTPTANRTISFPDATGTVALVAGSSGQFLYNSAGALAGSNTLVIDGDGNITQSSRLINTATGVASGPPVSLTGSWFSGGTSTTTKPQVLIEPAGATSTAWSTSGTGLGINAASGFTGRLLDLQLNGTSNFSVNSTGTVSVPLGSNTAPSVYFGADTNTGIYSPGADQLALATNGTGRLFIDSSGNVGINTAAGAPTGFVNGFIKSKSAAGAPGLFLESASGNSWWGVYGGTGLTDSAAVVYPDGGSLRIATTTGASVAGFSEKLRITSDGKVGVGTSSPARLFHAETINGPVARFRATNNFDILELSGQTTTTPPVLGAVAEAFTVKTAGSERLRIDSSGRVGIGTTSPSAALHVQSQIYVKGTSGDGGTGIDIASGPSAVTTSSHRIRTGGGTGKLLIIETQSEDANGQILFTQNGGEAARIDTNKRLLVGTSSGYGIASSGLAKFEVGSTAAELTASLTDWSTFNQGAVLAFGAARGGAAGDYAIVQDGDNLGSLRFAGADGTDLQTQAAAITAQVDGTPGADDMPGRLVFSTTADGAASPTERMRIGSNGGVKINTTSDTIDSSNFGTIIGSNSVGNVDIGLFRTARNQTGVQVVIAAYGNAGQFRTMGDGDAENTNNSYGGISDAKLKENIVDANSQWDDLKALQVRNYNFKPETGYNTHTQIGLIAQEVELVSPGLVGESIDEETGESTKTVNYSVLYMKAVKALQEAMERIETLEAKVAAL